MTTDPVVSLTPSMPYTVRVGAMTYTILTSASAINRASTEADIDDAAEWAAFSDHQLCIIGINPDHSVQANKLSVLHEVLHCCLRASGTWPDAYSRVVAKAKGRHGGYSIEEVTIQGLENTLLTVMRDNPALVAWLTAPDQVVHPVMTDPVVFL